MLTNWFQVSAEHLTLFPTVVRLEAQQIAADEVGSYNPGLVLGIDVGPLRGRRVLAAALLAEP